jgi:alkanesulfonate monooxygenase SsuD/methylene tetrahydromethanopterin reductase-like flavin-dependent oxidoreductase (luciferase family)
VIRAGEHRRTDEHGDEPGMTAAQPTNPMRGPNRFKLGVFSANCDGGLTMSLAPERWRADWDDIAAMCKIADDAGMEFILPVAKWRGYQGKANIYGKSFETLTHSSAIGALTKRICVFSTIHVPLITPAFGAKALATIDHVTHGRAGLNIVCGWNQEEFDLHGVTIDQDKRYEHGLEWFKVWSKLLEGGPEFDWKGEFFDLKRLHTDPVSVQRPRPLVMSAGFSPKGRDFAAQAADALFTTMTDLDQAPAFLADVATHMERYERSVPVYVMGHGVCRPTAREAEEFYHYFAEELADADGQAYYRRQRGTKVGIGAATQGRPLESRFMRTSGKKYDGAYPGTFPMVGTPDDVAADMARMAQAGLAGCSVAFLDYLKEIPYFVAEVLPRLERLGLRDPVRY